MIGISKQQKIYLDKTWSKIQALFGFRDTGLRLSSLLDSSSATSEDIRLWVDAATGDDANPGSQDRPLKTISAALEKVPYVIQHAVTIYVGPGVYSENVSVSRLFDGYPKGKMSIEGTGFTAATLTSGAVTGTISGYSTNVVTVTGAGWTADNLKGRMLRITSGTNKDKLYPIAGNAADTLELCVTGIANINSHTFEICEPAASIEPTSSYGISLNPLGVGTLTLSKLKLRRPNSGLVLARGDTLAFDQCLVTGLLYLEPNAVTFNNSALVGGAAYDYFYCRSRRAFVGGSLFDGGGQATTPAFFTSVSQLYFGSLTGSIPHFQNGKGAGLYISGGTNVSANGLVCRKNKTGMALHEGVAMECDTGFAIYDNTEDGVVMGGYNGVRGHSCLDVVIGTIRNNGRHGVVLANSGNTFVTYETSSIRDNGGFGVICAAVHGQNDLVSALVKSAFSNVILGSKIVMSGNVSGDITLDGTTAIAIADLRLDADKTMVDGATFNRVVTP